MYQRPGAHTKPVGRLMRRGWEQEAILLRNQQTPEDARLIQTLAVLTQRLALQREAELEDKVGSLADMMDLLKSPVQTVGIRAISLTQQQDKS